MGTRGLFGFYYKGKYYVAYNHFDSYPDGLGAAVVAELRRAVRENRLAEWIQLLEQLKVISPKVPPTAEDIEKLRPYTDLSVSGQSTKDWYCLLRKCQGSLEETLKSGYIDNNVDAQGRPDWKYLEYGYIVNFDTQKLDFYISEGVLVKSYDFADLDAFPSL